MTQTQPRFYEEADAAKALGLPLNTFRAMVRAGSLPGPVPAVGLFDLHALHAACDQISGIARGQTERRMKTSRAKAMTDAESR
jgi:hypothetical protein